MELTTNGITEFLVTSGMIAEDNTILGIVLRYIRYGSVGIMVAYFIPIILSKLKLVKLLDIKD